MRWWLVASLIYAAIGLLWLAFSGRVEGFTSPRTYLILAGFVIAPIAFGHLVANIYLLIGHLFKKPRYSLTSLITPIVAMAITPPLIVAGVQLDNWAVAKTKERAKIITSRVIAHKAETGVCPTSLEAIFTEDENIPKPAIRGASFDYTVGKFGQCYLKFPAHNWIVCNWNDRTNDWYCAD